MTSAAHLSNGTTIPNGFGLDIHTDSGRTYLSAEGAIRGYQSVIAYYPNEQLIVSVVVNRNGSGAGGGIALSVLADVVKRVFSA